MRKTTNVFLIDGLPILAPDADMKMEMEDVEAPDSGRDESGLFHRFMLRQGVGKWHFSYARLTRQEYDYMESLFAGKATFCFTWDAGGEPRELTAYRSGHSILWQSAATGSLCDYSFSIQGC